MVPKGSITLCTLSNNKVSDGLPRSITLATGLTSFLVVWHRAVPDVKLCKAYGLHEFKSLLKTRFIN